MVYTVLEFLKLLWVVILVPHGPAERLDPFFHERRCPLDAIQFGAVAEHRNDICWVLLFVPHEFESDAPEHGHTDKTQTRCVVDGVHLDIILLL